MKSTTRSSKSAGVRRDMPTRSIKKHRAAGPPSRDCLDEMSFPQIAFARSVCHNLTRNAESH